MKVFLITGEKLVLMDENLSHYQQTKAFIFDPNLAEKWCALKYHTLQPNRGMAEKKLSELKAEKLPDGRKRYKNLHLAIKK